MEKKNRNSFGNFKRVFIFKYINYTLYNLLIFLFFSFSFYRLESIHNANFIHRDLHSGNILLVKTDNSSYQCQIGGLELSQPANDISNNEIYGVIPYIAPEVLNGAKSSKESDIYSMGMIMWELTTGCKPFANVEHDHRLMYEIIDGERPEITNDTPKCFANLMKKCLDSDPSKRPSITEFCDYWYIWYHYYQLDQAEKTRLELINLGELGPKFNEKPHPKAIYTSRPLKSLITKCSSFNTISTIDISNGNNIDEFLCTKR